MNERSLFVAGARLLGLYTLTRFLSDMKMVFDVASDAFRPARTTLSAYLVWAGLDLVVGLFLLFAAHHIANKVCCRPVPLDEDEQKPGEQESA